MSRDFLYYLVNGDGRFYTVVNNAVTLVADPIPLQYTPDKWLDIEVRRQRNQKYFGLERSFTAPLDFVKDGAQIVKYCTYNRGVEDRLYLLIAEKRLHIDEGGYIARESLTIDRGRTFTTAVNTESDQNILTEEIPGYFYYYTALYKGELDLSQFKHSGPKVTVNILEGGAVKLLRAHENTVFEIPMEGNSELVRLTGIRLKQKADFVLTNGILRDYFGRHTLAIQPIAVESLSTLGVVKQDRVATGNDANELVAADTWFLSTGVTDSEITLTWDFEMYASLADGIGAIFGTSHFLQLQVIKNGERILTAVLEEKGGDPVALYNRWNHWQGSMTVTVPADSKCMLYMSAEFNGDVTSFEYNNENGSFAIGYTYTMAETYCQIMRPLTLFKRLAEKMGIGKAESNLLQNYRYVAITCGDAIRRIPGAVIKTSMSDFYKSFNAVLGAAITIENEILKLERKSDLIDYDNPIDLGEVKDARVSFASDYMFNTIKCGFPEQTYDDVNGRFETNNTHLYTSEITHITKELDLVSAYRADSYGIEFTRINLEGKATTDSSSDNDVFFVHIKKNKATGPFVVIDYTDIDRSINQYARGIEEKDTVYNLWLSPKQCLLRHGDFIRSCFYKMDHSKIKFQTTEKNSSLVVSEPGKKPVMERADVEVSELSDPLFQPVLFEITIKNPVDIMDILKARSRRSYKFSIDGVNYVGLPIKDGVDPATKKEQTIQLLSAPTNNLTQLIEYYG